MKKVVFVLLLLAGVGWWSISLVNIERAPTPKKVVVVFTPKPTPVATPKATPPLTLAGLLQPTFNLVFNQDASAQPIIDAAPEVVKADRLIASQPVPAQGAARDALLSARRICALMQSAVNQTSDARRRLERNSKVHPIVTNAEEKNKAEASEKFFARNIENFWRSQLAQLRLQAAAEMTRLNQIESKLAVPVMSSRAQTNARTLVAEHNAAERAKQLLAQSREIRGRVIQVVKGGVLIDFYRAEAIASSLGRIGMDNGTAASSWQPSGDVAFVEGVTGLAEGDIHSWQAVRMGVFNYVDLLGASRAVPRWVPVEIATARQ